MRRRRRRACAGLLVPVALAAAPLAQTGEAALAAQPEPLEAVLEPLRARFELPALAAAIVEHGELTALGAVGRRRVDDETPVTAQDLWHLGSCTKAMTATWIALHVERGELAWERTLGETFPELFAPPGSDDEARARPEWRGVTLELLLQNRGGAPGALDADGLWARLWVHRGTPAEQRLTLLEGVLARPPVEPPGTKFVYSNAGFAIAAAMAERALGVSYEEAIARELFAPLGMANVGFGAPGTAGDVLQPFGHVARDGDLRPVEPGPGADNPAAIAPAGRVHAALADWAEFAALHLAGARGAAQANGLLSAATFARLHAPALGDYAMGWVVLEPAWAGERVLWHNGSNTMWYCELALVPGRDCAVLVASNRGGGRVREGVGETLRELYRHALARRAR